MRDWWRCAAFAWIAAAAVTGCASGGAPEPEELLRIRGQLALRERIALPGDAEVVVELTRATDGRVIADQQIALSGRQLPIPFELRMPRASLRDDAAYTLRGAIRLRGEEAWLTDPVEVRAGRADVDVGALQLRRWEAVAFGSRDAPDAVRARGHEPEWHLELGTELRFVGPDLRLEGSAPPASTVDGARTHAGTVNGRSIRVTLAPRVCRDTMSGMPYPLSAEVVVSGRTFRGCGGEPDALLIGAEWVVEDIAGRMIDRSRATLDFGVDGRLAGRASCNAYTTSYRLTGETLTIGPTATTRLSCSPALMEQERLFLDILQRVRRFEITDTGALVLHDDGGRRITARRAR
jgi:heat shock protein HslJ/uncharacterized lipoprotein YbaY